MRTVCWSTSFTTVWRHSRHRFLLITFALLLNVPVVKVFRMSDWITSWILGENRCKQFDSSSTSCSVTHVGPKLKKNLTWTRSSGFPLLWAVAQWLQFVMFLWAPSERQLLRHAVKSTRLLEFRTIYQGRNYFGLIWRQRFRYTSSFSSGNLHIRHRIINLNRNFDHSARAPTCGRLVVPRIFLPQPWP